MLVNLSKNHWLWDWLQEKYQEDLFNMVISIEDASHKKMREGIARLLESKGYKTKLTSKYDIIISMTEEEFIYLKLKYS